MSASRQERGVRVARTDHDRGVLPSRRSPRLPRRHGGPPRAAPTSARPGRKGANHRIIDPGAARRGRAPRSGCGAIRAAATASMRDRDRPSACSRSSSHSADAGMTAVIAHPRASSAIRSTLSSQRGRLRPPPPRVVGESRAQRGIRHPPLQCVAQRTRFAGRHQHRRTARRHRLRDAADAARDDRDAAPQRVGDRHAVALRPRRRDEQVGPR